MIVTAPLSGHSFIPLSMTHVVTGTFVFIGFSPWPDEGLANPPGAKPGPTACFYMAHKLRMVFPFLNGWRETRIFHDMWKLCRIQILISRKFYWNTATLTCLHNIWSCSHTKMAVLSHCNRNCVAYKAWHSCYPVPYRVFQPLGYTEYKLLVDSSQVSISLQFPTLPNSTETCTW